VGENIRGQGFKDSRGQVKCSSTTRS